MDLEVFTELLSPQGQDTLQVAQALQPRESDFLTHFQALTRQFSPGLSRAALETAILRVEAAVKFPFADQMYFTRQALEQASAREISVYRAGRYRAFPRLIDLCCSIGADTLALAEVGDTVGIDIDSVRLAMARANAQALGLGTQAAFVQADLSAAIPIQSPFHSTALFFDPSRRWGGKRVFSVRDYTPPLTIIQDRLEGFSALGVKISPGVDVGELAGLDAELEFISLRGELKEAVLWFGPLKSAARRATLLPGAHTMIPAGVDRLPLGEPAGYLYEPDPAVLRAGLVAELGAHLNAAQLDADIAYLTAARLIDTPFARVWSISDWFPFGLKRLRAYLRARHIGKLVVKKRGSPLEPERLIRDLRLSGDGEALIFLTHLRGRPIVIYSEMTNPIL